MKKTNTRTFNVGTSDYSQHAIQCWDLVWSHCLTYHEGVMLGYLLRHKEGDSKILDYQKLAHTAMEVRDHADLHDRMREAIYRPRQRPSIAEICQEYNLDDTQRRILVNLITCRHVSSFARMFVIIKLCNKLISQELKKQAK